MLVCEELQNLLCALKEKNIPVIVEGIKDKKALSFFGVSNVFVLNSPLFEIVELVAGTTKECAILTDLDVEGKKLYSMLAEDLQHRGVKIDNSLRYFLFKETKLRQIEGLRRYLEQHIL